MTTIRKTVIINRAVPGSGKTSITRCILNTLAERGLTFANHSTDDYFMHDGKYCFDLLQLSHFHQCNLQAFERDLLDQRDVVICDNTNLMPWQTAPYTRLARQHHYQIVIINFPPRELWKHVQSQQVTPERPDAHQVPEDVLVRFIDAFNRYNPLLDPNTPLDATLFTDYTWDEQRNCAVPTQFPAQHFDSDHIITILPNDYHHAKLTIGDTLLKLILA